MEDKKGELISQSLGTEPLIMTHIYPWRLISYLEVWRGGYSETKVIEVSSALPTWIHTKFFSGKVAL